ncbi:pupal cuticle protein Edg-91-like [Chelonus insularis]|uniref:pupal cuticle protein Edg-91-like n=1 Tax=Chelonus insularis TaxID=460826 RepID=UPI00158DFE5D|nr:pupal cuticle protein Edg-91-like [Chelonus insularis]
MQITRVFVVLATVMVVGYAAIEPLDLDAEASQISTQHSRQKRGILAAKLGLLGGALLAKKALILGAGAGLIGGGLAGGAVYKLKSKLGGGYGGGYGGGGYNPSYYPPPSGGYYPPSGGGANLGEGVYPVYLSAYPRQTYEIYGGVSGGYNRGNGYANNYDYPPC